MTVHNFFLVERAVQVQRLRAARSGNRIEIPSRLSRLGLSPLATQLFQDVEHICQIPLSDERSKWLTWLITHGNSWLGLGSSEAPDQGMPALLTPNDRAVLMDFEKRLVELRLDDADKASPIADSIIRSIRADQSHFCGLKPLACYSDNFAYEFLFPSWLNLYTALVRPTAAGMPRFSPEQIRVVFDLLRQCGEEDEPASAETLGALTLIANRLPPLEAQQLMQRMLDLRR